MGDAVLSAFLQVLFQQLASPILEEFVLLLGVGKQLKKLSRTLSKIEAVLSDAEQRQIQEEAVRIWLRDLKDVAYDAEDLLDEMATEALRSSQVRNFLFSFSIAPKINEVIENLDEIAKEREDLHLREGVGGRRLEIERPQTSSLVDESYVFGRNDDREKIVSLLLSDDSRRKRLSVIPILGLGGLGKTTLAQLVYNDERVESHFELRMWVCGFAEFDVRRITKAIIESATGNKCDLLDMDLMQRRLQKIIKERRFLLVLDDVWNENYTDWDVIQVPFRVGAEGSKIIVTTRSEIVSSIMGTVPAHCLEGLSNEDCWSLFKQRAFADRDSNAPSNLITIGKKIVKKCQGLPLAVKTLGDLLRYEDDEKEWDIILKGETWDLPEKKNNILPILRLSYHHLPTHLKRCFGYCSIFPEDYIFEKDNLVLLWIAEGFIQPRGRKQMEDIGSDCFHELVSRSFFHYSHVDPLDGQSRYKMHGLIHDLAQSVMSDECFRMETDKVCSISKRARHVTLICSDPKPKDYEPLFKSKSLRTLLFLGGHKFRIRQIPHDLFLRLKCLRVLDMSHTSITELPNSIGNLKHLRYLDLSWTRIERLPESTTSLINLQTLKLIKCLELLELPSDMSNLINLRHLNISYSTALLRILPFANRRLLELPKCIRNLINLRDIDTSFSGNIQNILQNGSRLHTLSRLISTPPGMGKLTSLQTLSNFVVTKRSGCGVEELKTMVSLRGALCISKLENVVDVVNAKEANLKSKHHIHDLTLRWSEENLFNLQNEGLDENVIEGLQPHTNLKELRVENYGGARFPSWMRNGSLSNLATVCLFNCQRCELLPPLWQLPFLKYLKIHGMNGLKHVGRDFYGDGMVRGFLSLEMLEIKDMPNLEDWSGVEAGGFPCLRELTIWDCPNMWELPHLPPTLKILEIANCKGMSALPAVPSIRNLVLGQCDEMILSSLAYFPSLSSLTISHFPKLKCLPDGLLQHLASLKELKISDCDEFTTLPQEQGLQKLISLEYLEICCCLQLKSLQDEELPTKLKSFRIVSCPNLISLPKEIQNLTSLEFLEIWKCPQLLSLPENQLPDALQVLWIRGCPTLRERCQREGGEDWLKIAHVPNIRVDLDWIQQH